MVTITRWMKVLTAGLSLVLLTSAVRADEQAAEEATVEDTRPATLDYRPGQPVPSGYHVISRYHWPALTIGTIMFGTSYSLSVLEAATGTEASAKAEAFAQVPFDPRWLYLPIVGPWAALASSYQSRDCRNSPYTSSYFYGQCETAVGDKVGFFRAMLIVDGLAQGVGAALSIYGLKWRWYQLVLNEDASAALQPVFMGLNGQGLALVGTFR